MRMRISKIVAFLTVICICASMCFFPTKADAEAIVLLDWSQSIINEAVAGTPLAYGNINRMSTNPPGLFVWSNTMISTTTMYMLALMSYHDPTLATTAASRKTVSVRLIEHIKNLVKSGNEPSCYGGLGGWVDNAIAQSLVLAKNTPVVWSQLSNDEKARCDFIMKAMLVTGNYTMNIDSNPVTDMSQRTWWEKGWNPNHVEGYVGVMIAGYIYFGGADAVNNILTTFSYDEYIAAMDSYGYTNMKYCFTQTGKQRLEVGGQDAGVIRNGVRVYGTVVGAKRPFRYRDILTKKEVPYEPMALYHSLAMRMYYHKCQSIIMDGTVKRGWIADGTTSPFEDKIGMGFELISGDEYGLRTDIGYINTGWRNSIITRSTLQALGYFHGPYARDIQMRMFVGTEDFLYKGKHGYFGYEKGKPTNGAVYSTSFNANGFKYHKEIWDKYLKPSSLVVTTKLTKVSGYLNAEIRLENNFTGEPKTVVAYLNIYQGDKLVDVYSTSVTIESNDKEIEKNTDMFFSLGYLGYSARENIVLPAGHTARLMVWDADNELSPLADVKELR